MCLCWHRLQVPGEHEGVQSGGGKDEREKTVLGCSHMKEMLSF